MKLNGAIILLLVISSCASGKDKTYTASTPAAPVVKSFLGIAMGDSIDFIRWKLVLNDKRYSLHCNYGISKPNTNGFINGGKSVEISGAVNRHQNNYYLQNGGKNLVIAELNNDLLHIRGTDSALLVGNGGWSYTLNNTLPSGSKQSNIVASQAVLIDSMLFEGRTPCNIPGIVAPGSECYKLKWLITLYSNPEKNEPSHYKLKGTAWRNYEAKTGKWAISAGKDGTIKYLVYDEKGNVLLHLVKLDENVLLFTDADGKLLTGDHDFSYTLNRRPS